MGYETIEVIRVAGSLGAEARGADLSQPLSDACFSELHDALMAHHLIFLRDQRLSDEQQLAAASRFGEVAVYPLLEVLGVERPLETIEDSQDSPPSADQWHTDVTWIEAPPKLAFLNALTIPEYGGDTMWTNTIASYEELSPVMRRMLDGLQVHHDLGEGFFERVDAKAGAEIGAKVRRELKPGADHPLVRTHPVTGRKALFLAKGFMQHVVGMNADESEMLLRFLFEHATQPRFGVRWKWRVNDLAIWDERCTMHHALPDHFPQLRRMRRCTVVGDVPV
jgi:taurine dioxygenase